MIWASREEISEVLSFFWIRAINPGYMKDSGYMKSLRKVGLFTRTLRNPGKFHFPKQEAGGDESTSGAGL